MIELVEIFVSLDNTNVIVRKKVVALSSFIYELAWQINARMNYVDKSNIIAML
jgi:hypothetical protein